LHEKHIITEEELKAKKQIFYKNKPKTNSNSHSNFWCGKDLNPPQREDIFCNLSLFSVFKRLLHSFESAYTRGCEKENRPPKPYKQAGSPHAQILTEKLEKNRRICLGWSA